MNASTRFAAPWSLAVKIITVLSLALLLGASFYGAAFMNETAPLAARALVTFLPLALVLATLPFMVRGFAITHDALLVERLGWANRFPLADMVSVAADPKAMCGSIRLCGSGGLFGFFGWFRNRTLGTYRAYGTDPQNTVVVRLRHRTILVTPADPERFVEQLRQRLPAAAGSGR
jgi:hypothetical protein